MAKVTLGNYEFDVGSEEISAISCGVTDADCVAFAARMITGEISRVKRLFLVRFIVFHMLNSRLLFHRADGVREGQREFCRAATKSATRQRRRSLPLCSRTAAYRRCTL
jgi:hypothetical protein